MQDVKVSVFIGAYNQEKYIAKTLESVVNQKTNFKFEILVHDDASTDSTSDIIKEYSLKYTDLIFPVFQTENQYSKGVKIESRFLLPYAKGEFISWLDGDDYFSDENKLQSQVDEMEKEGAHACIHSVQKILNGKCIGYFPDPKKLNETCVVDKLYAFKLAIDGELHVSSLMLKKSSYETYTKKYQKYSKGVGFGDVPLFAFVTANEKLVFINKAMSVYNVGVPNGFMMSVCSDKEKMIEHRERSIKFFKGICEAFPLFSQKKIIKERIELEEYLLQVELKNYKVIFAKENKELFKGLAPKHKLKLKIGRIFPSLIDGYERKKVKRVSEEKDCH